jgi:hypothetical protein
MDGSDEAMRTGFEADPNVGLQYQVMTDIPFCVQFASTSGDATFTCVELEVSVAAAS